MRRSFALKAIGLLFLAASVLSPLIAHPSTVNASSSFKAGLIISNSLFTDTSMSSSQIQSFLNARNSTCLKNYQTASIQGNNNYGSNVSAATAIKQASNLFNISPKVILATLEKEQGIVTRSDCPTWRYQTAMGFGCPDTAPCDAQWFGLSRQLYQGARHFRGFYDQSPGWFVPFTPGTRYIQYNPSSSCGGKNVNIQNRATASLYSYTPYQPNAATLAAAPGQTVTCGAYGNLNFWRYYTNWFGSTQIDNSYIGTRVQGAGSSSTTMPVGTIKEVTVRYRNTGTETWYDTISAASHTERRPVVLVGLHPSLTKESGFNGSFATPTRATEEFSGVLLPDGTQKTGSDAKAVAPGETAEFTFLINTPSNLSPGEGYQIAYQPVMPASGSNPRINLDDFSIYHITLTAPQQPPAQQSIPPSIINSTSVVMKNVSYSATRLKGAGMSSTTMNRGTQKVVSVLIKNTGTETWYDSLSATANNARSVVLLALHPSESKESGFNGSFATPTRATENIYEVYTANGQLRSTTSNTRSVRPGEVARMAFTINAPQHLETGVYNISYRLVLPSIGNYTRVNLSASELFQITLTL